MTARDKLKISIVRECIMGELLNILIMKKEITDVSKMDDLTEEAVLLWFSFIFNEEAAYLAHTVA